MAEYHKMSFYGEEAPVPRDVWEELPCDHFHEYNEKRGRYYSICSKCRKHITTILRDLNIRILKYHAEREPDQEARDTLNRILSTHTSIGGLSYAVVYWKSSAGHQ